MEQAIGMRRLPRAAHCSMLGLATAAWLFAPESLHAQSAGCALVPAPGMSEQILRCGRDLVIRPAPFTRYRLTGQQGNEPPTGVQLDSGALLIEFNRGRGRGNFQIQTPHAIAAVRGTKWAVEVEPDRSSTLVVAGAVRVTRLNRADGVTLLAGQGVDVSPGTGPIAAKPWGKPRIRALLSRFGQ